MSDQTPCPNDSQAGVRARKGTVCVQASPIWLLILAIAVLAPWAFLLIPGMSWGRITDGGKGGKAASSDAVSHAVDSRPGPWGRLKVDRIATEPPLDLVDRNYLSYETNRWLFRGMTREKLDELLRSAQIAEQPRTKLLALAQPAPDGDGLIVSPDMDTLLSISPEAKATLYFVLSGNKGNNHNQEEPFLYRADAVDEWFEDSDVEPKTVSLIKKLLYKRGTAAVFSDVAAVMETLPTRPQKLSLLKTLWRQPTLLVKLEIDQQTDIEKMLAYWGGYSRAKDIGPLLESLKKIPGGTKLDIVHLLPAFARKRLYTYPVPEEATSGNDCHWASMNFWNDQPDTRFLTLDGVKRELDDRYRRVSGDYAFGDIILFMRSATEAVHSAVYIADDIVYTKNGPAASSPFLLMRLSRLVSYYGADNPVQLMGFRRKD